MKEKLSENEIDSRIVQLGERLVECTAKKEQETGLTQNAQGEAMGIKGPSLSRYHETESKKPLDEKYDKKIQRMGVPQLMRICHYYGVSADYMLGFTDDEPQLRKNGDNLIREICDFTGLSREAVAKLHMMNKARQEVIEHILLDDELFYSLMNFFIYDLLALYVESDYAMLPHAYNSPINGNIKDRREIGYAALLRELPLSQKRFSEKIKDTTVQELKMVHAMAKLFLDPIQSQSACSRKFDQLKNDLDQQDLSNDEKTKRLGEAETKLNYQKDLIKEIVAQTPPYGKNRFSNRNIVKDAQQEVAGTLSSMDLSK